MTKRSIVFLILYLSAGLAAFVLPQAGVWGFLFESNYHPPFNLWWGRPIMSLGDRWSFYIGAIMILATLVHWNSNPHSKAFAHPETILLILFTLNACLVTTWAYDVEASWKEVADNLKWLAVYLCIVKTHSDRRWLAVALGIYLIGAIDAGWMTTFDPKGGRFTRGGPATAMGENFLSPHVIALMPLAFLTGFSSKPKIWVRVACIIGLPLMLNVVAHGQSRGAFLALAAAALAMLVFARGRLRWVVIAGFVFGAILCMRLFHEQFIDRISTITDSEQDGSATGRTEAWKDAWQLSLKNPAGYGGEAFDRGMRTQSKSTHNMYFECLVAWGFQGMLLWLGYLGAAIWSCWKLIRKLYRPGRLQQPHEYCQSLAILVGMISMLVAAVFVNRMRWELWWVFPACVVCLKNIVAANPLQDSAPQLFVLVPPQLAPNSSVHGTVVAATPLNARPS